MDALPLSAQEQRVLALLSQSPIIDAVFARWDRIALPDAWLVAGALAQTVWNDAFQQPPGYGVADLDIVYFDARDLSEGAEAAHAARLEALFGDLSVRLDVKNEARVHLWYESKFGYPIRPYVSAEDAITTFPTTATTIGVRLENGLPRLFAPYGLTDLLSLTVRANKKQITQAIYEAKAARWLSLWPRLRVIPWDDAR